MERLFNSLGSSDLTNLIIDDTMAPNFKGMSFNVVARQMGWAKFDDALQPRSLLTVLTNGGSLCLYKLYGYEWVEVLNISKMWYTKSEALWKPIPEETSLKDLLNILRERAYRVKITAFAWTGSKSTTNLLFTGSMDGTLCAWEVSRDSKSKNIDVELLRGMETEQKKITSLAIIQTDDYKCLLIYATFSGQIQAIPVSITDVVEFNEPSEIWDEKDGLVVPPSGMEAQMVLGYVILAVAKGPHLLVFLITSESQLLSYTTWNSGDVSITGMQFVTSTELFLTTWSGKIKVISVAVESDTSIKLHSTSVEPPPKTENHGIMGVALSKSKALMSLAYSVKVNYNRNFVKELSATVFCTIPEMMNPFEVIKPHTGLLCEIWDALEVARIGFMKKPEKDLNLVNSMVDTDQFDTMEITQLKKNLWFLNSLLNSNLTGGDEEKQNLMELGKEIYNLITAHHVFKRSSTLLAEKSRSPESDASLALMRRWILYFESNLDADNFPSTQRILSVVLDELNECTSAQAKEVCSICGSDPEEDMPGELKHWRCSQGHELPRCSISFLQCGMAPHYVCRSCNIIAHPVIVEKEVHSSCIYCDGYLELPENMLGTTKIHSDMP